MLKDSLLPLALSGLLIAAPALATDTAAHSHGDHTGGELVLSLDAGEKWMTDPPLREGMTGIRDAVAAVGGAEATPSATYPQLADQIEEGVNYVIENCILPLEADLQLHSVLEHLLAGIEQLRTPGQAEEGLHVVVEALNGYGEHFDHEGWQPLDL